ncbi:MAG: AraC family transcriptional regulator [Verrucomicrobiota bacterium]
MDPDPQQRDLAPAKPPGFVMWGPLPEDEARDWERQWFGHELTPEAAFNVRGIGIREPLFNPNVHRLHGTGDWLVMLFYEAVRLDPSCSGPSHPAMTLMIWPPGAEQFYSWGKEPNLEPHTWMHVEGSWVERQIEALNLPLATALTLPDASVMESSFEQLFGEMRRGGGTQSDPIILQNLFENWARGIRRQLTSHSVRDEVPLEILRVRRHLDANFREIPALDELAQLAAVSRSHLCHRFRKYYGSSISEYVVRKRMAAAQRLLYEVDLRIGEIAETVGYRDIFQFSKQFKKSFGVSPSRYRKQEMKLPGKR